MGGRDASSGREPSAREATRPPGRMSDVMRVRLGTSVRVTAS